MGYINTYEKNHMWTFFYKAPNFIIYVLSWRERKGCSLNILTCWERNRLHKAVT